MDCLSNGGRDSSTRANSGGHLAGERRREAGQSDFKDRGEGGTREARFAESAGSLGRTQFEADFGTWRARVPK
jgi:hypothetical protein